MTFIKRAVFFVAVNIAILFTINVIISVLGLDAWLNDAGTGSKGLLFFCFLWGMIGSFVSLWTSRWMAKKFMGVQLLSLDSRSPQEQKLINKVHQFARQANLPKMPEVGIYHSDEINAFATGPSKSSSLVAVSSGLLHRLNDNEVDGVLAHEVAHIANGDMVTMTLIQGVVNSFVMFFAYLAANAISRGDDDEGGSYFMEFLLRQALMVVFGILASPIVNYFSRWREFRADAGSAKYAGKEKMIQALEALKNTSDIIDKRTEKIASFKISSSNKKAFAKLFMTHPPLEERIKRLQTSSF